MKADKAAAGKKVYEAAEDTDATDTKEDKAMEDTEATDMDTTDMDAADTANRVMDNGGEQGCWNTDK